MNAYYDVSDAIPAVGYRMDHPMHHSHHGTHHMHYGKHHMTHYMPTNCTIILKPKFMEHLKQHIGKKICVMTTAGKLEGILDGVFIDHLALVPSSHKKHHVLYSQIVYFE